MNIMILKDMSEINRTWLSEVMLGKRISAIKEYRNEHKCDLKTAKTFIEGFIEGAFYVANVHLIEASLKDNS